MRAVAERASRRGWGIVVVSALAQLMVALDATIVGIALPTVQRALGISTADRQCVITAYAVTFGGWCCWVSAVAGVLSGAERESVDGGLLFRLPAKLAGPVTEHAAAGRGVR